MSSWSCDMQVCGSCRYWLGRRKIDFMAYLFEMIDTQGECAGPQGSFKGLDMGEGSSCMKWEAFRRQI